MSTILVASTACQQNRLGTTSGKGYYSPNVRVDGLGATCSPLGLLRRAASSTEGSWTFFLMTRRLCTARNYYWSKTQKPSDEPPTDQEHRPGDRADEAHRARLMARSIISYGSLSLVKSVFVFCFFLIALFKSSCVLLRQCCLYCTALCRKYYLLERRLFCEPTSIKRFSVQNFRFLKPSL